MDRRRYSVGYRDWYRRKAEFARPMVWRGRWLTDCKPAGALTYAAGPKVIGAGLVKQRPRMAPPAPLAICRAALRA
jgi:hypothetical protein